MHINDNRIVQRKLKVLNHAKETGNVAKTCRYYGISRQTFYDWKRYYDKKGIEGLSQDLNLAPALGEFREKLRRRYFTSEQHIILDLSVSLGFWKFIMAFN